jgi:hypothetical protein
MDKLDSPITKFEKEIDETKHCNPSILMVSVPAEKQ